MEPAFSDEALRAAVCAAKPTCAVGVPRYCISAHRRTEAIQPHESGLAAATGRKRPPGPSTRGREDPAEISRSAFLKRRQRARQNNKIVELDTLLPEEARSKPFKGAGPRSTGLRGRSVGNVLADCIRHIKSMHLQAAAARVDAAAAETQQPRQATGRDEGGDTSTRSESPVCVPVHAGSYAEAAAEGDRRADAAPSIWSRTSSASTESLLSPGSDSDAETEKGLDHRAATHVTSPGAPVWGQASAQAREDELGVFCFAINTEFIRAATPGAPVWGQASAQEEDCCGEKERWLDFYAQQVFSHLG